VYLFVSLESVLIQVLSLLRLRGGKRDLTHRHLVRTVLTRVIVMSVYVGVGVTNLITHTLLSIPALAIFTGAALVWQVNSLLDVRLRNKLNGHSDVSSTTANSR
jgi:heme A synthase